MSRARRSSRLTRWAGRHTASVLAAAAALAATLQHSTDTWAGQPCGAAERAVGAQFPQGVTLVGYIRDQPSPDLSLYTAYLKLTGDTGRLDEFVQRLHLHPRGDPVTLQFLPAAWAVRPGLTLPWWDATSATPMASFANRFGVNGRIVAKIEGGALFIIVTDTGVTP